MRLGKIKFAIIFTFLFNGLLANEKIFTAPIINLENLEPSYESQESEKDISENDYQELKKRNIDIKNSEKFRFVNLIGLDKITAKTKKIKIRLGDTAKFGLLEIKALRCGTSKINQNIGSVAYIQVKDISEGRDEKEFIFNGWTFSENPSITPIDHAIYDVWLVNCESA